MTPLAEHLRIAVDKHQRWCRDNGYRPDPELDQLVFLLTRLHSASESREALDLADDVNVPIALPLDDAGRLLGVSGQTVDRLVKAGHIKAVLVGKVRRIPRSELERYVNEQLEKA